jgi:hypothetical protein
MKKRRTGVDTARSKKVALAKATPITGVLTLHMPPHDGEHVTISIRVEYRKIPGWLEADRSIENEKRWKCIP